MTQKYIYLKRDNPCTEHIPTNIYKKKMENKNPVAVNFG